MTPTLKLLLSTAVRRPAVYRQCEKSLRACMVSRNKRTPECQIWSRIAQKRMGPIATVDPNMLSDYVIRSVFRNCANYSVCCLIATTHTERLIQLGYLRQFLWPQDMHLLWHVNPNFMALHSGVVRCAERTKRAMLTTALAIAVADGYFAIRTNVHARQMRFMRIISALPMELAMVLARRAHGLDGIGALPTDAEWRFFFAENA